MNLHRLVLDTPTSLALSGNRQASSLIPSGADALVATVGAKAYEGRGVPVLDLGR